MEATPGREGGHDEQGAGEDQAGGYVNVEQD